MRDKYKDEERSNREALSNDSSRLTYRSKIKQFRRNLTNQKKLKARFKADAKMKE